MLGEIRLLKKYFQKKDKMKMVGEVKKLLNYWMKGEMSDGELAGVIQISNRLFCRV
jgi:hypothetical protein